MVIALPALWLITISLAFYLAAKLILTPAIVGILQRAPLVGGLLARAASGIVQVVENTIARWVSPHLATLIRWLEAAAIATLSPALALLFLARRLDDIVKLLVENTVGRLVHAVTNPIVRVLNADTALIRGLRKDLTDFERATETSISAKVGALDKLLTDRFAHGIDRLQSDILDRAIPALKSDVFRVTGAIEGEVGTLEHDLAGAAGRLADLAKRLDIPLSVIESLVASIGVVAAVEALGTLATCRGKLRTLCTSDAALWEQFILGTLLALEFPGLRELTKMGATLMEDVSGVIREVAES